MGLLQRMYPRPIEAKTERNANVERVVRGSIELSSDFNSDKQGQDALGPRHPSPEGNNSLCDCVHHSVICSCKKIIKNLNIQ